VQPGILVRGEFVGPGDHIVARPPRKPLGNQIDACGGVADQGDFLGLGSDHLSGSSAEGFDLPAPLPAADIPI